MKDVVDLVSGYFTLKKLQKGGYIRNEDFNLSFSEFIFRSIKAINEIETEKGGQEK